MSEHVILLVEDNLDDELLTLRAFEKCGIANPIVVARDGSEALDYLLARGAFADRAPGLPVLMLVDVKMPIVDGFELLKRLRADPLTKTVPVLMLTSSKNDADVSRAYELGANGYVQKPVEFDAFLRVTRSIGAFWLLTNVSPDRT